MKDNYMVGNPYEDYALMPIENPKRKKKGSKKGKKSYHKSGGAAVTKGVTDVFSARGVNKIGFVILGAVSSLAIGNLLMKLPMLGGETSSTTGKWKSVGVSLLAAGIASGVYHAVAGRKAGMTDEFVAGALAVPGMKVVRTLMPGQEILKDPVLGNGVSNGGYFGLRGKVGASETDPTGEQYFSVS